MWQIPFFGGLFFLLLDDRDVKMGAKKPRQPVVVWEDMCERVYNHAFVE